MNKIVIVPDSFKGTLSAIEICNIIKEETLEIFPKCEVVSIPIADGGEGTVDAFLMSVKGKKIFTKATGPYFEKIQGFYGLIDDGKTAIIEMAAVAGLNLVSGKENPLKTTTYGVGQLILHAIRSGAQKVIIGLGGSCTNDGGCGLAAALGVKFLDKDSQSFIPVGETLDQIISIDRSQIDKSLRNIQISAMCDVTNPLYGPEGAAYIFAPQKGANEEMVKLLDKNLQKLGFLLEKIADKGSVSKLPGAGAAGGLGAGLNALFNIPLVSGIDMILETIHFNKLIHHSDLIITGEGQIDEQSLDGKAISGISHYAKANKIPLCVIAGQSNDNQLKDPFNLGISGIFTINRKTLPFSEAKYYSKENLRYTIKNVLQYTKAIIKS